jgi:hypothetical protein
VLDERKFLDQLDRLEQVWRRLESPLVESLRPGLSDERIGELMAPTGLTLSDELKLWWGWHDGAPTTSGQEEGRGLGPGGWLHLSLSEAVDLHSYHEGFYQEMIATGSTDIAELVWRPGLFPLSHRGWQPNHVLAADTLVAECSPSPVVSRSEMGIERDEGASSVSEVIGLWIELLESGRYRVEDGSWQPLDRFYAEESRFLWLL